MLFPRYPLPMELGRDPDEWAKLGRGGYDDIGVKDVIGTPASDLDFSGELMGVKEAAELAGKDRGNFLRDLASREDFPKPIVSLASGRYWLSAEIERYLRRKEKVAG